MSDMSSLAGFRNLATKIVCVGRNYKDHALELGNAIPKKPMLFVKTVNSFIVEGEPIVAPPGCQNLHQEVELGVVISKKASRISKSDAMDYIGGYTVALDMTARDFQDEAKKAGAPWFLAKSFDGSCPIGGFLPVSAKRRYNPSANEEEKIPIVEKLYRENQESDFLGGGFCDDDDEVQERREQISEMRQKREEAAHNLIQAPENCEKCDKGLMDSWLWERYNCAVCDACRDDKGEHKLLARTEVKNTYLLKDCDLDLRKPKLRYWAKKNPHNPRYGDMKLYLKCQIETRVLEVHGSWEDLELKKELREQSKEVRSEKRFEKKLKDLRQQIRGTSGVKVDFGRPHTHEFGKETHVEEDTWRRTCITCEYEEVFEKL